MVLFTSAAIRELLLESQAPGGSINASIAKLFLNNLLPSFGNYNPLLQRMYVDSLIANQQPLATATTLFVEHQRRNLFREARLLSLSTREYYPCRPKEESTWWKDYLVDEPKRSTLRRRDNNKESNEFRRMFRLPFVLFEELVLLTVTKQWYDPTKVNGRGVLCSNLELLILGVLHVLGKNADNHQVSRLTNISEEVHRVFFHKWCGWITSLKDDYIYMPVDEDEAEYIEQGYAKYGLVGCVGSIDCVHIGWDSCRAGDRNSYCGKEKYPSISYEVVCSNQRKILSVTHGFPGTRNDKTIVKTDATVRSLRAFAVGLDPLFDGTSFLSTSEWRVRTLNGSTKTFKGKYFICDGGYLRWPCLVCGVADASHPGLVQLCKTIAAVRKDIECVFGSLKKRFLVLKAWSTFRQQACVDNTFITCCILHNMLLEYDGYLDPDVPNEPTSPALQAIANKNTGCQTDAMWVRASPILTNDNGTDEMDNITVEENGNWLLRLEALGNHILATQAFVKESTTI